MNKLVTSPRHDKLCQQVSKYYAISSVASVHWVSGVPARLSYSARPARTPSSAVPSAVHRPGDLQASHTEKGLCYLYHFESDIIGSAGLAEVIECMPALLHARRQPAFRPFSSRHRDAFAGAKHDKVSRFR